MVSLVKIKSRRIRDKIRAIIRSDQFHSEYWRKAVKNNVRRNAKKYIRDHSPMKVM